MELPIDFNNYNLRVCAETGFTGDAMGRHKKNRPWTRLTSSMGQGHKSDQSSYGKCILVAFITTLVLFPIFISALALNPDLSDSTRTHRPNAIYENVIKLMDHLSTDESKLSFDFLGFSTDEVVDLKWLSPLRPENGNDISEEWKHSSPTRAPQVHTFRNKGLLSRQLREHRRLRGVKLLVFFVSLPLESEVPQILT